MLRLTGSFYENLLPVKPNRVARAGGVGKINACRVYHALKTIRKDFVLILAKRFTAKCVYGGARRVPKASELQISIYKTQNVKSKKNF